MQTLGISQRADNGALRSTGSFVARCLVAIAESERQHRLDNVVRSIAHSYDTEVLHEIQKRKERDAVLQTSYGNGNAVLQQLYNKLDAVDDLDYPRSHHQKQFHECFIRACLRSIFGDEYARNEQDLLRRFEVASFKTEVMIVTPRRFGKTFAVAQYCAAFTAGVLGKEVAIFSTGRRASKKMLDLVWRFLEPIMPATQKVVSRNVEEIVLLDTATGKRNKVCSYPSKVQVRV